MIEITRNPILKVGPNTLGQILFFFGARHTNDPTDAQFDQLRRQWDEFMSSSKGERMMFTEGPIRDVPEKYEDAIEKRGEVGAAQWLAKEADVTAIYPEPDETQQRKTLCASYSPQDVAYTLIVQNLAGWFRHSHDATFIEAVERSVNREAKFADIYDFTPDVAWFRKKHTELFGNQKLENKDFLDSIADPRKNNTLVNQIVAERTKMRNNYILERITETWNTGKSVFIVYGKGHLAILEPALKKLV